MQKEKISFKFEELLSTVELANEQTSKNNSINLEQINFLNTIKKEIENPLFVSKFDTQHKKLNENLPLEFYEKNIKLEKDKIIKNYQSKKNLMSNLWIVILISIYSLFFIPKFIFLSFFVLLIILFYYCHKDYQNAYEKYSNLLIDNGKSLYGEKLKTLLLEENIREEMLVSYLYIKYKTKDQGFNQYLVKKLIEEFESIKLIDLLINSKHSNFFSFNFSDFEDNQKKYIEKIQQDYALFRKIKDFN